MTEEPFQVHFLPHCLMTLSITVSFPVVIILAVVLPTAAIIIAALVAASVFFVVRRGVIPNRVRTWSDLYWALIHIHMPTHIHVNTQRKRTWKVTCVSNNASYSIALEHHLPGVIKWLFRCLSHVSQSAESEVMEKRFRNACLLLLVSSQVNSTWILNFTIEWCKQSCSGAMSAGYNASSRCQLLY